MSLEFRSVSHSYSGVPALIEATLSAKSGRITCLLGPSGCGKTTLMRLAAGILPLQVGEILLGGETLATAAFSPPPEQRPVGVVFQEGALFPHMTVAGNIGFGLRQHSEKSNIINTLLDQVGLSNFSERYPHMLSGGQQQRVALARALAPAPQVLLLDEPFANIDISLRKALRQQTRAMLKDSARIVMLVTHDPEEALEMADEIVVLSGGKVLQAGPPQALYDAPEDVSVATLISEAQPLKGRAAQNGVETAFGVWPIDSFRTPPAYGATVTLAVRAHDLRLEPAEAGPVVTDHRLVRGQHHYLIESGFETLAVLTDAPQPVEPGSAAICVPASSSVFSFPAVA